jgi:hypothetical protein
MRTRHSLLVIALVTASALAGCNTAAPPSADAGGEEPAHVEHVEGSELALVTLTQRSAERLGIQTAPVAESGGKLQVPYGAVYWDAHGDAWAYVEQEPLAYMRHPLAIESIDGDTAVLTDGPPAGSTVVSVGTIELIGTEFEVGH